MRWGQPCGPAHRSRVAPPPRRPERLPDRGRARLHSETYEGDDGANEEEWAASHLVADPGVGEASHERTDDAAHCNRGRHQKVSEGGPDGAQAAGGAQGSWPLTRGRGRLRAGQSRCRAKERSPRNGLNHVREASQHERFRLAGCRQLRPGGRAALVRSSSRVRGGFLLTVLLQRVGHSLIIPEEHESSRAGGEGDGEERHALQVGQQRREPAHLGRTRRRRRTGAEAGSGLLLTVGA